MPVLPEGSDTSGSTMTIGELIKDAMLDISAVASGENPTPEEYRDCLRRFNSLIGSWAAQSILLLASTSENFELVAGTAQYSMGSEGTASDIRAEKLLDSTFIRDSGNTDHPVKLISEAEYNRISLKTLQVRPYNVFYDTSYPIGYINFYPVPDAVETAYIESLKPISEVALSDISSTLNLSRPYEEALRTNLAIRIAPMFQKKVPAEIAAIAVESYDSLIILNAGNKKRRRVEMDAGLPGVVGSRYNINTG